MARLPLPSVVVFVADVARLTAFYRVAAGMSVVSGDETHSVLEVEQFQLVIHGLRGEPRVTPGPEGTPRVRQDTYIKVCLPVESLAEARGRIAEMGGRLYSAEREWEARGFRACDGFDPEGNVFQLREAAV